MISTEISHLKILATQIMCIVGFAFSMLGSKRVHRFLCTLKRKFLNYTSFYFSFLPFKKILLNLLGGHWLIKLDRIQVYGAIIHHLYTVLYVHHPKSSLLPSPFIPLPFLPPPTPFSLS